MRLGILLDVSKSNESCNDSWTTRRLVSLFIGPLVGFLFWLYFRPITSDSAALSSAGAMVIGLLGWMAIWWATQAVDLAVTGLLPIVVLPLLRASTAEQVLTPYANDVIFLFAGGCVLGIALEQHGLGKRFLLLAIRCIGDSPGRIVAAFLLVAALISAWVSNTATAAMMLPLATAAVAMYAVKGTADGATIKATANFQRAVLLAIAYGASIGGVMSVLGSPPNPIGVEWINANGGKMDFVRWASVGVPTGVLMMLCAQIIFWFVFPFHGLRRPITDIGEAGSSPRSPQVPLTRAAKLTLIIFGIAVVSWVGAPFLKSLVPDLMLKDGLIAVAAAIALFILPAARGSATPIVPWSQTERLPWGVFILFGGGLSLADAMQRTGVSQMIAQSVTGLGGVPEPFIIAGVATIMIFASEIASNTALAATAVPILGAMAPGLGIAPEKLVVTAVLGASLAFMLPVGTPPNAIVFSTGLIPVREMIKVGFLLNLCAVIVITVVCTWLM